MSFSGKFLQQKSLGQVATGTAHSVLLRSDGHVVACGDNRVSLPSIWCLRWDKMNPFLLGRVEVRLASAMFRVSMTVVSFLAKIETDTSGTWQSSVDLRYVQVSAAGNRTLLLRSDGKALAIGDTFPPLAEATLH